MCDTAWRTASFHRDSSSTHMQDTNIHTGAHRRDVLLPHTSHSTSVESLRTIACQWKAFPPLMLSNTYYSSIYIMELSWTYFQKRNWWKIFICMKYMKIVLYMHIYMCMYIFTYIFNYINIHKILKRNNKSKRSGEVSAKMVEHQESVSWPRQQFHWQNLSEITILELCSQLMVSNYQGKVFNCKPQIISVNLSSFHSSNYLSPTPQFLRRKLYKCVHRATCTQVSRAWVGKNDLLQISSVWALIADCCFWAQTYRQRSQQQHFCIPLYCCNHIPL